MCLPSRDHELEARSSLGKWVVLDLQEVELMGGVLRPLETSLLKRLQDSTSCGFILGVISPSICSGYCDTFGHKVRTRIQLMLVPLPLNHQTVSKISILFWMFHFNNKEGDQYRGRLESRANKAVLDWVSQKQVLRKFWWSVICE